MLNFLYQLVDNRFMVRFICLNYQFWSKITKTHMYKTPNFYGSQLLYQIQSNISREGRRVLQCRFAAHVAGLPRRWATVLPTMVRPDSWTLITLARRRLANVGPTSTAVYNNWSAIRRHFRRRSDVGMPTKCRSLLLIVCTHVCYT